MDWERLGGGHGVLVVATRYRWTSPTTIAKFLERHAELER